MSKRILIISQYFYPEQFRINDLASEWVKRGYQVTVVTGVPNYPQGKFYPGYGGFKKRREKYNGAEVIRLPILPRGHSSVGLVLNYLSFVVSGFCWKCFTRVRADAVFIFEVSPMTQALPGIGYAKRRKIPCFLYVTDLWPENVVSVTGLKNTFVINAIQRMVDGIYRRCDRILTSSRSFIPVIRRRGVPAEKLMFWPSYAERFYQRVAYAPEKSPEIPRDGTFNILFAGNIGVAQGLQVVPRAAQIIRQQGGRVCFNIVGDGRYKETLLQQIDALGVGEMFRFINKQPPERIPDLTAACDAALICLDASPVFEATIPAKAQSYLACGIPIIVSAGGEIQDIARASGAGVASDAGDAAGLAQNILRLLANKSALAEMGDNALRYSKEHFDSETLLNQMDALFGGAGQADEPRA